MNFIQKYQYNQFVKRDPWREARAKSGASLWQRLLIFILGLLGKRAMPLQGLLTILRENRALIIDLSSYQPNANIEGLIDAGITHIFLRMLYIGQYVVDNWQMQEDPTYRVYFDRIRAYAAKKGVKVVIGGYILYTAKVEEQDYKNSHIYTDMVAEIMEGTRYRPDVLWIDDEVDYWWEGATKKFATDVNQVAGCAELWRKLRERFHITVGHYSGAWFINKYKAAYTAWFDRMNYPGGREKLTPIWTAWYPVTLSQVYTALADALALIPTPTSTQKINLLDRPGSYSYWDAWQVGYILTLYNTNAAKEPSGLDFSISRESVADFNYALGIVETTPPPDQPPDQPPDDGGGTPVEWMGEVETRLGELETWAKSIAMK